MVDFKKKLSPIQDTGDYVEWANTLDSTGKDSAAARGRLTDFVTLSVVEVMMYSVIKAGKLADKVKKFIFYGREWDIRPQLECNLTLGEYSEVFARFNDHRMILLFHAVLGMVTEAGELMEAIHGYIRYGIPINAQNILEELGDSSWYHALGAKWLGHDSLIPILQANYRKLVKRYPDGEWTKKHAVDRDVKAEMEALDYE